MTRLAMLAVLLLALAPSASRLLAAGTPQVLAGWSELCTSMGLQTLPSAARSAAGTPAPLPAIPAAADCDYCALAASLPLLLLVLVQLPPLPRRQLPFPAAPRLRTFDNLRGLGCRGPPILL